MLIAEPCTCGAWLDATQARITSTRALLIEFRGDPWAIELRTLLREEQAWAKYLQATHRTLCLGQ